VCPKVCVPEGLCARRSVCPKVCVPEGLCPGAPRWERSDPSDGGSRYGLNSAGETSRHTGTFHQLDEPHPENRHRKGSRGIPPALGIVRVYDVVAVSRGVDRSMYLDEDHS
jgi:hypothetical protein